jgi:hypothetical protein
MGGNSKTGSSSFGVGGGAGTTGAGGGGGGGGGGKVLEKRLMIFKKELEKFIKATNKTQDEGISKHQRRIIREMIISQSSEIAAKTARIDADLKNTMANVTSNQTMFKHLDKIQQTMLTEFEIVKKKFADSTDMIEVNLKRGYRDKMEYKAMYAEVGNQVAFNSERLTRALEFVAKMTNKVNSLTEVQKLGMAMSSQDELDKGFTQLYGIQQAEGKKQMDLDAP